MALPCHAKELSPKQHSQLAEKVRRQYELTQMQGTTIYKHKGKRILVSVVAVRKSPDAQRVAQVKASRSAGEFLQGAVNKSITVYEIDDEQSYALTDDALEKSNSHNGEAESSISQTTGDQKSTVKTEKFTDKIVQSSISNIRQMQPLCLLSSDNHESIYSFYIIL